MYVVWGYEFINSPHDEESGVWGRRVSRHRKLERAIERADKEAKEARAEASPHAHPYSSLQYRVYKDTKHEDFGGHNGRGEGWGPAWSQDARYRIEV